jgi:dimethylglycine dehydrogenase
MEKRIMFELEQEYVPILDTNGVLGGLFDKNEGHLDCSGVTWAYAKCAQQHGAQIHQHTKVESMKQLPNGSWELITDKGKVVAEHVVNAGGLWAREVGEMAGVHLPLLPMQHHYIITEPIEKIKVCHFIHFLTHEALIFEKIGCNYCLHCLHYLIG